MNNPSKQELIARLNRLVLDNVSTRREQALALCSRLEKGDFFWAPASTNPNYHLAVRGGLAMHTINFIKCMIGLVDLVHDQIKSTSYLGWAGPVDWSQERNHESAVIIGLCHDLNKTTLFGKGYYRPNMLKSGQQSDSKPYERIDRFRLGGNLESLMLAHHYIDLYPEEMQAIAWCEGLYNRQFTTEVPNPHYLTHLAHMADMMSSHVLERQEAPALTDRTMVMFEESLGVEQTAVTLTVQGEDLKLPF